MRPGFARAIDVRQIALLHDRRDATLGTKRKVEGVLEEMRLHLGPNVEAMENEFASYCGTKYAIGVGSGTDAITIALASAGIKTGDEIITTPHTFFATVEAIVHVGAIPVFADIDPDTYNIDPSLIEKKMTDRTKAILPVHIYGQSADMTLISDIAQRYGVKIIEDACQAHGAEYLGKKCGSFGDAGCFSFYYTKNLGAYGEAGIITTNDPHIDERARKYRTHGHKSKYEHVVIGYNSRLDEMQAAVLRVKLRYLDQYNEARRAIAKKYNEQLKDTPLILSKEAIGRKHIYHLYVIRCKERGDLQQYLADADIETGIHYENPVHLQEACRSYGYKRKDFPVTENICEEILSLPVYPELEDEGVEHVVQKIKEFYGR